MLGIRQGSSRDMLEIGWRRTGVRLRTGWELDGVIITQGEKVL